MSTRIDPISLVGLGIKNIFSIPFNTVVGAGQGIVDGVRAQNAGRLATLLPTTGQPSVGITIFNFLRNTIGNLFAGGLKGIANGKVGEAITELVTKGNFKAMSTALSKVGGKGLLLLGGYGFLAGAAVIMGTQLLLSGWKKVSELSKGYPLDGDNVRNPWIHGTQALFGGAMAVGGVMAFIPGVNALGAATCAAGFAGAMVIHGLRNIMGGMGLSSYFRYPDSAIWPLNHILRWFKNDWTYYGVR